MTQEELLEYLKSFGCYIYKEEVKPDGSYFFIRKEGLSKKDIAILFPPKRGTYKKASVCHICMILLVKVPDFCKDYEPVLKMAKEAFGNY